MRLPLWAPVLLLAACAPDEQTLDPLGDEDLDGYTNADEEELGSDPFDDQDVPYEGGWRKDDCDGIVSTGNDVGDIAENFTLTDQFGQDWHLEDFCGRVLLIEFSGFS